MKTFLIVVWLLSNGQFQGEPWIEFTDQAACQEKHENMDKSSMGEGRYLFLSGCIDEGVNIPGIQIDMRNIK